MRTHHPIFPLALALAALAQHLSFLQPAQAVSFTNATPMAAARHGHTATLLPNGRVLVAGGYNSTNDFLSSAELFDPATGRWTATGEMTIARYNHTATMLPNGKVLVAGGCGSSSFLSSAEV